MQMAISALLFVFLFLTWCCVIVALMMHEDKTQHWDKLKMIITLSCGLFGMFHLVFLNWVLPFVSCTFESNVLKQFQSVKCWSMQNVSHLVLSSLFIVLQIPLSLLGVMVTTSISFDWRNSWRNVISCEQHWFVMILTLTNQLYLVISQVFIHPYGRPLLYMVMNMVVSFVFFRSLPFFNLKMNSVVGGILIARFGMPIGSFLSSILNTSNRYDLGVIFLLACGLGVSIFLFLVGFTGLEIYNFYIKIQAKKIKNLVEQNDQTLADYFSNKTLKNILKLCITEDRPDFDIFKIITAKKKKLNTSAAIMCSLYTAKYHEIPQFSLSLMSVATAKANIFSRFVVAIRKNEIENKFNNQMTNEIRILLDKVAKYQDHIRTLRKSFWQALLSNEEEKDKLSNLSTQMYHLEQEIDEIFDYLQLNYPQNVQIARKRQCYLSEFKFQQQQEGYVSIPPLDPGYHPSFVKSMSRVLTTASLRSSLSINRSNRVMPLVDILESPSKIIVTQDITARNVNLSTQFSNKYRDAINAPTTRWWQKVSLLWVEAVSVLFILCFFICSMIIVTRSFPNIIFASTQCHRVHTPVYLLKELKSLERSLHQGVPYQTLFYSNMKEIQESLKTENSVQGMDRILEKDRILVNNPVLVSFDPV